MNVAGAFRVILMVVPLLIAGCGGGGGGASSGAPAPVAVPPPAQVPPPPPPPPSTTPETENFLVQGVASASPCTDGLQAHGFAVSVGPCVLTDAAQVTVDGRPFDVDRVQDGTQDGSVMLIRGSRTSTTDVGGNTVVTSVATSVDIQHVVVGPIDSVDAPHARLSALGQQIYVSDTTRIDGDGTLGAFVVGERIAVSGFFSSAGEVVATSIKRDLEGEGFLLRGILHIEQSGIIRVGQLAVSDVWDYAFDGFPGTGPAEGDPVLVLGRYVGVVPVRDSFAFVGGDFSEDAEEIRYVSGMISSMSGPSEFSVEGRPIDCTFFQCETLVGAQLGTLVSVVQDEHGNQVRTLAATSGAIAVIARVEAVDTQNNALQVLGFAVQVLPATDVVDDTLHPTRITDIQVGDTVTIEAGPVGDVLVASYIGTFGEQTSIRTRVFSFADPEVQVLTRSILTDTATVVYEDCVGQRDQSWLFEPTLKPSIRLLRIEVSQGNGNKILAARIDVETDACDPWGY